MKCILWLSYIWNMLPSAAYTPSCTRLGQYGTKGKKYHTSIMIIYILSCTLMPLEHTCQRKATLMNWHWTSVTGSPSLQQLALSPAGRLLLLPSTLQVCAGSVSLWNTGRWGTQKPVPDVVKAKTPNMCGYARDRIQMMSGKKLFINWKLGCYLDRQTLTYNMYIACVLLHLERWWVGPRIYSTIP